VVGAVMLVFSEVAKPDCPDREGRENKKRRSVKISRQA
jgi:hypothetical protein